MDFKSAMKMLYSLSLAERETLKVERTVQLAKGQGHSGWYVRDCPNGSEVTISFTFTKNENINLSPTDAEIQRVLEKLEQQAVID